MLPQAVSRGGRTIWISLNLFSYMALKHIICVWFLIRENGILQVFWFSNNIYHMRGSLWSIQCSAFHISTRMLHVWQNIDVFTCRQERRARGTHSFAWSSAELKNWCSSSRNVGEQWARAARLQILLLGCTSFHFPFRKHWNCCQLLTQQESQGH